MRSEEEIRRKLEKAKKKQEEAWLELREHDADYYAGIVDALEWVLEECEELWI